MLNNAGITNSTTQLQIVGPHSTLASFSVYSINRRDLPPTEHHIERLVLSMFSDWNMGV